MSKRKKKRVETPGEMRVETRKSYPVHTVIRLHVEGVDEAVSGLTVWHHGMRIGSAVVPMGGIGGVWTGRDHRYRGYSRRCMNYSTEWMRGAGMEIALLFGIRDFYPKFGYAVAAPAMSQLELTTRDAEQARGRGRVRKMTDADRGAVLRIYERENATRTGTVVRDRRRWKGYPKGWGWGNKPEAIVCVRERRITGYAAVNVSADSVRVAEVGAIEAGAYEALIGYAARRAVERRCERFQVHCPPDLGFVDVAGRFNCSFRARFMNDGDFMLRVLDVVKLLQRCSGELTLRLDRGGREASRWRGNIEIATDEGTAYLSRAKRAAKVSGARPAGKIKGRIALRQDVLAQLLAGYRDVEDATTAGDLKLTGDGRVLAPALFPRGWPFIWRPDMF